MKMEPSQSSLRDASSKSELFAIWLLRCQNLPPSGEVNANEVSRRRG